MRKSIFVLALFAGAVAGLTVAIWLFLPDLAKSRLATAGFGEVACRVERVSLEQLVLSDIRFGRGQEQRADRLTILFDPMRLLRTGSVDSVSIEGADLRFVSGQDGIPRFAGVSLSGEIAAQDESRLLAILARKLEIKDSLVNWETDEGVLRIPLEGVLTQTASGYWTLHGKSVPYFRDANADLAMIGKLEPDGTASIKVDISRAEGELSGLPQLHGKGEIRLARDKIGRLSGVGKLEVDAAESHLVVDAWADEAETADSAISFGMSLKASDLEIAALGELAAFGRHVNGSASVEARIKGTLPFDSRPRWRKAAASGRLSLEVTAAGLDDLVENTTGRIDAEFSFSGVSPTTTHLQPPSSQLTDTRSQVEGSIDAKIDVSGAMVGGNQLTEGAVRLQGLFVYDNGELVFRAEDCISLKAKTLDLGIARLLRPFELCAIQPAGKPLLHLDPSGSTTLDITLPSHSVALAIGRGRNPIALSGTLPEARMSAALDRADGSSKLELNTQGGSLELTGQAVALSDIELSLVRGKSTSVTLTRAVAHSLSKPSLFPVLILGGSADGRSDGAVSFKLAARGTNVPVKLSASGTHDFTTAIGEMSYELDKIRFSPDGTQPGDVFPALGRMIRNARGSLATSGEISWVAGVPVVYSRLALSNLGFDAQGLQVRGVNTRLQRASKTIRNHFATQEIRVDLLDVGVPFRKGLIRFHSRKAPLVRFEKIRFAWGGGTLQTEPFDLRLDKLSAEHAAVLKLSRIQLDALLELIPIDGLQGTGTLSGRIPLRIRGSQTTFEKGSVSADTPGVLRYRPEHRPAFFAKNSNTELLFKALSNFHYESVAVGLNGRSSDDLQLSISLSGANPDLYDGHPFKLNFNVTGELDTILRRVLHAADLAESLAKRISTYLQ